MIIRKAQKRDLDSLTSMSYELEKFHQRLSPKFFLSVNNNFKASMKKVFNSFLRSPLKIILVAEVNGQVVGYISGQITTKKSPQFKVRTVGAIYELFVQEKFRKQGVAQRLMTELCAWFKSKKVGQAEVTVTITNERAKRLYFKQGFKGVNLRCFKKL